MLLSLLLFVGISWYSLYRFPKPNFTFGSGLLFYLVNLFAFRAFFLVCRADMFSESQRIKYDIENETKEIPDARAYLLKLKDIRTR